VTQLTASQVAGYWEGAGGPASRAVEWVAISIGESGFVTDAVSSAGAVGLWQIMPFNAPTYGYSTSDLYDPHVNAVIAVAMSGGGTNCAAWDSCYRNISASGRYTFLAYPEVGSADYNNLSIAAAELGRSVVTPVGSTHAPGVDDTLAATVTTLQRIAGQLVPAQTVTAGRAAKAMSRMYR
jgi:hypothetical protein